MPSSFVQPTDFNHLLALPNGRFSGPFSHGILRQFPIRIARSLLDLATSCYTPSQIATNAPKRRFAVALILYLAGGPKSPDKALTRANSAVLAQRYFYSGDSL